MTFCETIHRHKVPLLLAILVLAGLYASIVQGMVADWYRDENYSHGFLVPVIAGFFLYRQREELLEARVAPSNLGAPVIVLALVLLIAATLSTEYFTLRASLVVLIAGTVLHFFGRGVFRTTRLAIFYLFFMVPLPYIIYDSLAFPLKLFVSKFSVAFLKAVGIAVVREGNIIMFPAITLEVADACSGIRSLISLLALSSAYAFFLRTTSVKRWVIVFSAIPLAIFTNALRVIVTGVLAHYWGGATAEGFFHEFAGLAVFALAMTLLVIIGALLNRKNP